MNKYFTLFMFCVLTVFISNANAADKSMANYKLFTSIQDLNLNDVQEAINNGADPNAQRDTVRARLPLEFLASHVSILDNAQSPGIKLEIAKLLLKAGAAVEACDNGDLLFFPIAHGDVYMLKLFLDNGVSPIKPIEGKTPMELAVYYKKDKIVQLLNEYGVQKIDENEEAQVCLMSAVESLELQGIVAAIHNGAILNKADSTGKTALIQAVGNPIYKEEQLSIIKYMLDEGADPNLKGESGLRGVDGIPVHIAVVMNTITMNKHDGNEKLAIEMFQILLKHGVKVSAIDSLGRTPLHLAAKDDNLVAARMLIDSGCRIMARDYNERTPLDYAESKEMISLLKTHGAKEIQIQKKQKTI